MNDRCAAGTGATIDKSVLKVGVSAEDLGRVRLRERHLHHVAAKCGVFAEMDVVNLLKAGVPADDILCSLGDAIVQQNLSVLARGNTLKPHVLLLGGPNFYLPFLQDCWRQRIAQTWAERGVELPPDVSLEELVRVPEQALYCAAYGAVLYGLSEAETLSRYRGMAPLRAMVDEGRRLHAQDATEAPLVTDAAQLAQFTREHAVPAFDPPAISAGGTVRAALGVDGGSTSTKAVLLDEQGQILQKAYRLSQGNPIQDTKELLEELRNHVTGQGAALEIIGFGVTGYAAGVLERCMRADVDIAETIAHMRSAVTLFGDVDVICDVGGQDIKVLFMRNGELQQFRLSNQCSAGNGMLLQATAGQFGIPVQDFAEHAFRARVVPRFTAGCAVFLDSHRVTLQREGFRPEELMAGLARVLPKNIWQYVVQVPRLASLGRRFVLQGGTQYNLAAVKAQVDYLRERVPQGEVFVHPHPGEAGAIGAALEALEVVRKRGHSTFVGMEQAIAVSYTTRTDESTRCPFCQNHCARTFIDTQTPDGITARYISGASCERGLSEDTEALKAFNRYRRERGQRYPNLVLAETQHLFATPKALPPLPAPGTPCTVPRPPRPRAAAVHAHGRWGGSPSRRGTHRHAALPGYVERRPVLAGVLPDPGCPGPQPGLQPRIRRAHVHGGGQVRCRGPLFPEQGGAGAYARSAVP
jgi:predicted CoA-substrate-specific enzyme activase